MPIKIFNSISNLLIIKHYLIKFYKLNLKINSKQYPDLTTIIIVKLKFSILVKFKK